MSEDMSLPPSLGITPGERVGILRAMPWVAELPRENGHVCHGRVKRSKTNRTGQCRYAPRWRYAPVSAGKTLSRTRNYCGIHIFSRGLYGEYEDMTRTDAWCNRHMIGVLNRLRELGR